MNSNERMEIATQLTQLYWDFDPYQFGDTFDDKAQANAHTEEMLMYKDKTQSLIALCNDILESDSEELHQEALAIKDKLMNLDLSKRGVMK